MTGSRWGALTVGLAILTVWGILGCTSTPPRYSEDYARLERIVDAVKHLRDAYVNRDVHAIDELLLPLDSLNIWAQDVRKDFEVYSDIALDLWIERIEIKDDLILTFVVWHGTWRRASTDSVVRARGHGILYWSGSRVILLSGTDGDLPFGMAVRTGES
ncbi:MAG: hypothetical protein D6690_03740 [Nitrospirae bacterium]|nr:MAG: hypothetical protein D6690_03740 [Nitrospirota bacterium]